MPRPPTIGNLRGEIRRCIASGCYLDTFHSTVRQQVRQITRPELLYVLRHGWHEKQKDVWDEHFNEWKYAIRGETVDRRRLRVIVSFDGAGMLIITAIDLDQAHGE